tara:strand:+ start:141 stop:719 length:579 start_codon:yes stop_codon:yes gene_type:complete
LIIFFADNTLDSKLDTEEEIVEIEKPVSKIDYISSIDRLEIKLLEKDQKLRLRENIIDSLKNRIKVLEENNDEMIQTIKQINLNNLNYEEKNLTSQKLQKNNFAEIEKLQETINKLNNEIKQINDNYLFMKKGNENIKNQIGILENNNNTLQLQKDIAIEKIEELKQKLIDKDKLINDKDKLIKEMKDKIHH